MRRWNANRREKAVDATGLNRDINGNNYIKGVCMTDAMLQRIDSGRTQRYIPNQAQMDKACCQRMETIGRIKTGRP